MKPITEYLSTKVSQTKIKATDETIKEIVIDELDRLGHDADLNHIDTSKVTDMNHLFSCDDFCLGPKYEDLNPNISKWNVSKVKNMEFMFDECKNFNCDISGWDVSNVENMSCMFLSCEKFNQDISRWDVGNVEDMCSMFVNCNSFNQNLSSWDISKVKATHQYVNMFYDCPIREEFKPKF